MSTPIYLSTVVAVCPIMVSLTVVAPVSILASIPVAGQRGMSAYEVAVKNGFVGTEQEWLLSLRYQGGSGVRAPQDGSRKTGVDAGAYQEMSMDDDYMYYCVVEGPAGVAEWRKIPMFIT